MNEISLIFILVIWVFSILIFSFALFFSAFNGIGNKRTNKVVEAREGVNAIEVAKIVGWLSFSKIPHNNAVLLAAHNEKFFERGLIFQRDVVLYNQRTAKEWLFTQNGVREFLKLASNKYSYSAGDKFLIIGNNSGLGRTNNKRFYVYQE